jgi:hypothetical protein
VRVLEDAALAVRAQASAHRCGLAVAAATALQAALRRRDDSCFDCPSSTEAAKETSTTEAATVAAAAGAAATAAAAAGLTFRVLGKRSGAGHNGFSSDDLKRACAAALLQTNDGDPPQRDKNRAAANAGASDGSKVWAIACRLRRVDAPSLAACSDGATVGLRPAGDAASDTFGASCADLYFLARVHDTSFSLALLLHDGTLNKSPVNPAPRKVKPIKATTKSSEVPPRFGGVLARSVELLSIAAQTID